MAIETYAVHYVGGSRKNDRLSGSFETDSELELDKLIDALKIAKTLLRRNIRPLPRNRSLVPT